MNGSDGLICGVGVMTGTLIEDEWHEVEESKESVSTQGNHRKQTNHRPLIKNRLATTRFFALPSDQTQLLIEFSDVESFFCHIRKFSPKVRELVLQTLTLQKFEQKIRWLSVLLPSTHLVPD